MSPNPRTALPIRIYGELADKGSNLQSFVLLALRLTLAWQLAESGYGHLHNVSTMVENFRAWGVPLPRFSVYVSALTELVGGALLLIGLATRLVSIPLAFNFLVAYLTAGKETLKQVVIGPGHLEGYDKFINDSAFTMLVLALVMLAFGPGRVSVDYALKRTVFWRVKHDTSPERHGK